MPDLKKMLTLEALSEALPSWLKRSTKPEYNADEIDSTLTTNQFVTASDKDNWNAKGTYSKPSGGIPKSDLSSIVQTSLEKADSALQSETDPTVPSWAKQTNKPSYTQDEVADGSTYKRVTQTEKDTWSGKQNALTTPQMQAVNSGITSEKVTQISTNQTNILYSLEHGAKNLFRWNKWVNDCTVVGGTKSIDAYGKLILTSSSTDCYTEYSGSAYPDVEIAVKENEQYVLMWEYSRLAGGSRGIVYVVFEGSTGTTSASASAELKKLEFTTPSGTTGLRIYINQTANGMQEQYYDFMVCSKVIWDTLGHDYQPPSVSNYDLTVREAEDRAALIEQVDEGAKNVLNHNGTSFVSNGVRITYNADKTITFVRETASNNDTFAQIRYDSNLVFIDDYCDGNHVLSGCPAGGSSSTYLISVKNDAQTYTADNDYGNGILLPSKDNKSGIYIQMVYRSTYSASITFKPMICTKPKWDISHEYEPFTLPNTDLTRMMTPFFTVPINHNMIYRGQNLGETFTEAQDTALSSGNFTDLYLGDYWTKQITIPAFYEVTAAEPADWSTNYTSYYTKSGDTYTPVTGDTAPTWAANTYYERLVPSQTVTLKAVIADFDTFYAGYASGYAAINTHHAAVIVTGFSNVVWNKTNSTAGGYVASLIHKWLVRSALPQIETWFGSAKVLSHQKLLTNAITGDAASGWAWSSQKISLLSENQMYGSKVWGNSKASNGGYEPGEAFKHLNVFNHIDVNLLFGSKNIWLRDIASALGAAYLDSRGYADSNVAAVARFAPAALILLS